MPKTFSYVEREVSKKCQKRYGVTYNNFVDSKFKFPKNVLQKDTRIRRAILRGVINSNWDILCSKAGKG